MRSRLLLAVLLLSPAAALGANDWTITLKSGVAVMDELSTLTFTITNSAASTDPLTEFTLAIPQNPYDVDGGIGPAGWVTKTVDRKNKKITFSAAGTCPGKVGIAPGASADFQVRVMAVPGAADRSGETLANRGNAAFDVCNNVAFSAYSGTPTWSVAALGAVISVSPRTLDIGGQVTVTLQVTNHSTGTQNTIVPTMPVFNGATFAPVSGGPTPSSVNLLQDGVATFTWVYQATSRGVSTVSTSARNGTCSSPTDTSLDIDVGQFPASVSISPSEITSGGTVKVRLTVANNSSGPFTNVAPISLSVSGLVQATLISPTPAAVPSLPVGGATAFEWTYRITGTAGATFKFSGQATAIDSSGFPIASDPVGSSSGLVTLYTVTANPSSVQSNSGAVSIQYTVVNGDSQNINQVILLKPDATFGTPTFGAAPSGWTTSSSKTPSGYAWSTTTNPIPANGTQTFTMNFATVGAVPLTTAFSHRFQVTLADTSTARTSGDVTVFVTRPLQDVTSPVALASVSQVQLFWTNPSIHDGVLILRSTGAVPTTAPTQGRTYVVGNTIGNATVIYADTLSFATSYTDSTVTNGTTYYYRIYNHDEFFVYAPGNTPSVSPNNQLMAIPTTGVAPDPLWCYTVGYYALQQPYAEYGKAVYQSSNTSSFTANIVASGPPTNGQEKWRPSQTRGVVQARPTMTTMASGGSENFILVGDQSGYTYKIRTSNGAVVWTGNGGAPIGEVVQAQAVPVLRNYASLNFQARYPTDIVFFGTRNNTSHTNNTLRALWGDTGSQAWSYPMGNMDWVLGAPLFDYDTDRLWLGTYTNGGTLPALQVIDVINPANPPLLTVSDMGDISASVMKNYITKQALVVDKNGLARGYDLSTLAKLWEINLGGSVSGYLVPYVYDFIASTPTGVQRYHVDPTTQAVTTVWAAPTAMTNPTAARIDFTTLKLYVGDGLGYLRRLDLTTGAIEASVRVSTSGAVSMPSYDQYSSPQRIYVGTADGRLCAMPVPF